MNSFGRKLWIIVDLDSAACGAPAMRLPRMTTRRWMIAVLVFGLGMGAIVGGDQLKRRRNYFLYRARFHALTVDVWKEAGWPALDPSDRPIIEYDAAMARKYWRAARYPWLPVEPDPPDPDPFPSGVNDEPLMRK
jgi:hypothetical protein